MGKHKGLEGLELVPRLPTDLSGGRTLRGPSLGETNGVIEHRRFLDTVEAASRTGRLALHTGAQVAFPISPEGRPLMGVNPDNHQSLGGVVSAQWVGRDWEVSLRPLAPVDLPQDMTRRRSYGAPIGNSPRLWDHGPVPGRGRIFNELVAVVNREDPYKSQMFGRREDGIVQELRDLTIGSNHVLPPEATVFARVYVQSVLGISPQQ